MKNVRIIYPVDADGNIVEEFRIESIAMSQRGFFVGTCPTDTDEYLIYRGPTIRTSDRHPSDGRFINNWEANRRTQFLSLHYHLIAAYTIPTFFLPTLNESQFIQRITEKNWSKAFIRSDSKSLFFDDISKCIWPISSISSIKDNYVKYNLNGPFAVRLYIDEDIFIDEQRYWVLNGHPYHPSGIIPDMIRKVASEVYHFSRSHYFTIDAAENYIVEINPGESSDRGCENPLDFFCGIFVREFL